MYKAATEATFENVHTTPGQFLGSGVIGETTPMYINNNTYVHVFLGNGEIGEITPEYINVYYI
jgi:hypothetical protein